MQSVEGRHLRRPLHKDETHRSLEASVGFLGGFSLPVLELRAQALNKRNLAGDEGPTVEHGRVKTSIAALLGRDPAFLRKDVEPLEHVQYQGVPGLLLLALALAEVRLQLEGVVQAHVRKLAQHLLAHWPVCTEPLQHIEEHVVELPMALRDLDAVLQEVEGFHGILRVALRQASRESKGSKVLTLRTG